jgi:heat shock protein HslJ/uncharacterized lipoprotein NlpE involved in copper resistance
MFVVPITTLFTRAGGGDHTMVRLRPPSFVALLLLSALLLGEPTAAAEPPSLEPAPPLAAHGLRLPATFTGELPCADCPAIRYHLNLWPDQVFMLRRSWLGKGEDAMHDDIGRWSINPERRALMLWAGKEAPLQFEIKGDHRLRLLDLDGNPIVSDLPYDLAGEQPMQPLDVTLPLINGLFVYFADAARLTECLTGRSYPVAMEGDYLSLERAYLEKRQAPAEPLMVSIAGGIQARPRMEGEGTEPAIIVDRFINAWPGQQCAPHRAAASLTNTYWRIVRIGGEEVHATEGRREPHLLLRSGEPRFAATVGCNQMLGGFQAGEATLSFKAGAMTMMACPPPLDQLEHRFIDALNATKGWRIAGQVLELLDADGKPLALFEAVYLR